MEIQKNDDQKQKTRIGDKPFVTFLTFCKADKRLNNYFDFIVSTGTKISIVQICFEEFLNYVPYFEKECLELEEKGFVSGIHGLTLLVKYETFLNSIYSLMENIAFIIKKLYPKANLSASFNKQKKHFTKNKYIDPKYSLILDELSWYDEIGAMRSESIHFLSGFVLQSSNYIPGYFNKPFSNRERKMEHTEIKDIVSYSKTIIENLFSYLDKIGTHFLEIIDGDSKIASVCVLVNGCLGAKEISYNEFKNGYPGICKTTAVNCPHAEGCQARIKL